MTKYAYLITLIPVDDDATGIPNDFISGFPESSLYALEFLNEKDIELNDDILEHVFKLCEMDRNSMVSPLASTALTGALAILRGFDKSTTDEEKVRQSVFIGNKVSRDIYEQKRQISN